MRAADARAARWPATSLAKSRGSGSMPAVDRPAPRPDVPMPTPIIRRFAGVSASPDRARADAHSMLQAQHRLTAAGERMARSAKTLLRNRRDRFAVGRAIRLKTSRHASAAGPAPRPSRTAAVSASFDCAPARAIDAASRLQPSVVPRVSPTAGRLARRRYPISGVLARGFALVRDAVWRTAAHAAADVIGPGAAARAWNLPTDALELPQMPIGRRRPRRSTNRRSRPRRSRLRPGALTEPGGQGSLF